jgi:hypothetical protein
MSIVSSGSKSLGITSSQPNPRICPLEDEISIEGITSRFSVFFVFSTATLELYYDR